MEHSTFSLSSVLEPSLPEPFEPSSLDTKSDAELDLLPFGVICVDEAGTVLKYNLAEARLARLDRNQVLGKSFFRVVAPCTATPDFEGRFRSFVKAEPQARPLRFQYLFDFKFGAQEVDVEIQRSKEKGCFFFCINRTKFRDPRANLPQGFAAPLQKELAPEEEQQGVARNAQARRLVTFDAAMLSAMRSTWDKLSPKGWELFCESWGIQWGRLLMIDLETDCLEKADKSLRELSTYDALGLLSSTLKGKGWGELRFDFSAAEDGAFVVYVNRSAVAESVGASEIPRCQLLSGLFQAMFTTLSQQVTFAKEISCQSQGEKRCTFILLHHKRKQSLQRASQQEREVAKVLRSLKESHRGNR